MTLSSTLALSSSFCSASSPVWVAIVVFSKLFGMNRRSCGLPDPVGVRFNYGRFTMVMVVFIIFSLSIAVLVLVVVSAFRFVLVVLIIVVVPILVIHALRSVRCPDWSLIRSHDNHPVHWGEPQIRYNRLDQKGPDSTCGHT